MEGFGITINAVLFNSPDNIELIPIKINETNWKINVEKLKSERYKIIDYFKQLYSEGKIKSIYRPKNKQMKAKLKELVELKKEILKNINKIKMIYQ